MGSGQGVRAAAWQPRQRTVSPPRCRSPRSVGQLRIDLFLNQALLGQHRRAFGAPPVGRVVAQVDLAALARDEAQGLARIEQSGLPRRRVHLRRGGGLRPGCSSPRGRGRRHDCWRRPRWRYRGRSGRGGRRDGLLDRRRRRMRGRHVAGRCLRARRRLARCGDRQWGRGGRLLRRSGNWRGLRIAVARRHDPAGGRGQREPGNQQRKWVSMRRRGGAGSGTSSLGANAVGAEGVLGGPDANAARADGRVSAAAGAAAPRKGICWVGANTTGSGATHSMQNLAARRFSVPQDEQTRAISGGRPA